VETVTRSHPLNNQPNYTIKIKYSSHFPCLPPPDSGK
jgi:hypothetical protein